MPMFVGERVLKNPGVCAQALYLLLSSPPLSFLCASPMISWSAGSACTSWQAKFSISSSRSRSSLCLWTINLPRLHTMAWSTVKVSQQTQVQGVSAICQSYRKWMASLNSLLFRVKFIFLTEMIVSQVGAPFSEASSAALLLLSGGTCFTSSSLSLDWHLSVCGYSGAVLLLLVIKIIIIIIT